MGSQLRLGSPLFLSLIQVAAQMTITAESRRQLREEFGAPIDIEIETNGHIAYASEFILAGREVRPKITYFWGQEKICSISSRPYESEEDMHKALMEMFHMLAALKAHTTFLMLHNNVTINNGEVYPAIICVTLTPHGALTEAYPYKIIDGEMDFLQVYELDEEVGLFSKIIQHMLPVFSTTGRFPFYPSEVLQWLASIGHDINFFSKYNPSNLDV